MNTLHDTIDSQHSGSKNTRDFERAENQTDPLCNSKQAIHHSFFKVKDPKKMSPQQLEYLDSFFRNIIRAEIERTIKKKRKI